jgi:hypothetical protein
VDAAVAKQITGCLEQNAKQKQCNKQDPSIDTPECVLDDPKGSIRKAGDKTPRTMPRPARGRTRTASRGDLPSP